MTLRTNPEFAALLNAALANNTLWSTAFKNGLGSTRRVICKWAPAGTVQANIYNIGTVFRNAAISGDMVIAGGIVTNYGVTSNLTVCTAADLATNVAVLRIEGNGNWIEGTIGLTNSGCDFILPANPTTTNSIAVTPNMRIKPPPFLPSGTGYTAPALSTEAPEYIVFDDWRDPKNVVEAGRIYFNKRLDNWNFTDPEMAAEMGDIRVTASTHKVQHGEIEFGAMMFSLNSEVNSETGRALHQVIINQKPTSGPGQNWPNYPRYSGYRQGTRTFDVAVPYGLSDTFAPPFKARLCKADGTVLHTWEMPRDGLPINSPELSEFPTNSKPIRLHMHCAQLLFWESHKPKRSKNSKKYFPGMDKRVLRPGMAKEKASYAGVYRVYTFADSTHGIEHWFGAPKYAHAASNAAYQADPVLDPYMWTSDSGFSTPVWAAVHGSPASDYGKQDYSTSNIHGLFYEPGNPGLHNHSTGPGGVRIDRSFMAGPTMIHLTDPTYVHLRTNLSIDVLAQHWNMNYFNHGCHFFLDDVRSFKTLPFDELLDGKWAMNKVYYKTDGTTFTAGGADYAIPAFAVGGNTSGHNDRPHNGAWTDANYRMPWNGYSVDNLHDYTSPADVAIHYNSPAHAYSAKHRYAVSLMCHAGASDPNVNARDYFAKRQHAWRLLSHARMWKLSSDHPECGVSQQAIEARLIKELTRVYYDYYVPMYVENSTDIHMLCLKRFGVPIGWNGSTWSSDSFGLTYYMSGVLMFMRQIGLFSKLWAMGEVTQKALLCIIRVLDAGSIQYFTQTKGSYMHAAHLGGGSVFNGAPFMPINHTNFATPELPQTWAEWRNTKWPIVGKEDWIHNSDGSLDDPDTSEHLRGQWPGIRLGFFRDIECLYNWTEVEEAKAIVDDFHNQWQASIDAAAATNLPKNSFRLREWNIPVGYAPIQAPNPTDVKAL